jgi:two-component system, sensor histidine kinase and response regulator
MALSMLRAAARLRDPFQLALIDFQMPGMDGEQLALEIRSEPGTSGIPLILVTSVPRRGDAAKMVQAGFDGYLVKPVKLDKLYEVLATVLGIRQNHREEPPRNLVTQHSLNESARGRLRVLVVEDNVVNQRVTTRMLERSGCRCDVAANGREAVDALERIPYGIVFMDCQMPVMDGFEATREIRKREINGRRTPIIAMTSHALRGDRERCLEAGMDDYLSKPVTAPELRKVLERYLDAAPHRSAETAREEPGAVRTG